MEEERTLNGVVCMYYVCSIYVCVREYTYVVCMYVYVCVRMYARTYVCVCMYVCMHAASCRTIQY
jgi:hypothetical protein